MGVTMQVSDTKAPPPRLNKEKRGIRSAPVEGAALQGSSRTPEASQVLWVRERYLLELRAFIERHKRYPASSRLSGEEGQVEVAFSVSPDGSITDVRVKTPCLHDRLNEAAAGLVANLKKFQPIPQELVNQAPLLVSVPIRYRQLN